MPIFSAECRHCGSLEHASDNCPHGVFSKPECRHCGSKEHASDDCPHGFFSKPECRNCGSIEHASDNCPHGIFSTRRSPRQETEYSTSSSSDNGCAVIIGWLIGIAIIVAIIIWLAVNVVFPVVLLNSALAFTILALCFKERKTLFAALALVGGCYLLADVFAGWLSVIFVTNVVGNPIWITCFAYLNAAAVGLSSWFLVQPLWADSIQLKDTDKRKSVILMVASILLVAIATVAIPLIYHFIPTSFTAPSIQTGASTTKPSTAGTSNSSTSNVSPNPPATFQRNYEGTIGNQNFSIYIVRDGSNLSGQASTSRKTDTLSGTIDANGQFAMNGFENGKRFTGIYKGNIYDNGTIDGSWTKPDGTKETSFSVSQK